MRLKASIIAVLLALVMALAPFGAPRAFAHEAPRDVAVESHDAASHAHGQAAAACDPAANAGHDHARHDNGQACCGMGFCHVFQVSAPALLGSPLWRASAQFRPADEQVEATAPGGLDRPPRTA